MNRSDIIRMGEEADEYADRKLGEGKFHPEDWHDVRDERFAELVCESFAVICKEMIRRRREEDENLGMTFEALGRLCR